MMSALPDETRETSASSSKEHNNYPETKPVETSRATHLLRATDAADIQSRSWMHRLTGVYSVAGLHFKNLRPMHCKSLAFPSLGDDAYPEAVSYDCSL